jgi:hypothetical protein
VRFSREWISSDETMTAFMVQLAELPGVPPGILIDAHRRERVGRTEYGIQYLGRDNCVEAFAEAADGLVYAHFDWLNDVRRGIPEIDADLLDAAHHFALAYAAMERKRRKG